MNSNSHSFTFELRPLWKWHHLTVFAFGNDAWRYFECCLCRILKNQASFTNDGKDHYHLEIVSLSMGFVRLVVCILDEQFIPTQLRVQRPKGWSVSLQTFTLHANKKTWNFWNKLTSLKYAMQFKNIHITNMRVFCFHRRAIKRIFACQSRLELKLN